MKYFLIKGFKGKANDMFMMEKSDDFILFVAFGLKDLENTLKGILAKGYRVRKGATYSRRLNNYGSFQLLSMFRVPMVEVKEVDFKPPVEKQVDYPNKSRGQTFKIKVTDTSYWDMKKEEIIKVLDETRYLKKGNNPTLFSIPLPYEDAERINSKN